MHQDREQELSLLYKHRPRPLSVGRLCSCQWGPQARDTYSPTCSLPVTFVLRLWSEQLLATQHLPRVRRGSRAFNCPWPVKQLLCWACASPILLTERWGRWLWKVAISLCPCHCLLSCPSGLCSFLPTSVQVWGWPCCEPSVRVLHLPGGD